MSESDKDYTQEFEDEESQFEDEQTSSARPHDGDDGGDSESGTAVTGDPALDTSLDDEESFSARSAEASNRSSVSTSSKPAPPPAATKPFTIGKTGNAAKEAESDHSDSSSLKSNSEIEKIMKKLERLEQAQNLLENYMNTTNEDFAESSNTSVASSVIHSARSHPTVSHDASSYSQPFTPGVESNSLSQEMDSLRKLLEEDTAEVSKAMSVSEGQDRSVDELLKEYEILEKQMDERERERPSSRTSTVTSSKSISAAKKSPYESGYGVSAASVQMKMNEPAPFVVPPLSRPAKSQSSTNPVKPGPEAVKAASSKSEATGAAQRNDRPRSGSVRYEERVNPLVEKTQPSSYSSREVSNASGDSSHVTKSSKQVQNIAKDLAKTIPTVANPSKTVQKRGSDKDMSKASGDNEEFAKSTAAYLKHQEMSQEIQKLQTENLRQEALLGAYQKENENLFSELREIKAKLKDKEEEHSEEVGRLKTEIATLKLNRLVPASPRFGQKPEVDKLNEELAKKSEQILELHREVARLKTQTQVTKPDIAPANKNAKKDTKPSKALMMSQEKEAEYQRNIRSLQKQVRTLQKILYHKDPNSAPPGFGSKDDLDSINPNPEQHDQMPVLENRIAQLEAELAKSDLDSKEKLKEFQLRFTALKTKYEERIHDLEQKLKEAENASKPPELSVLEESAFKLERAQNEIIHLKLEISKYKRELEIAAKSMTTPVSQVTARQDAGTLSLAIKSFKSELADKDKELIRIKKEVVELKKTNANLKREREKYLSSNAMGFQNRLPVRTKSETIASNSKANNSTETAKNGGIVSNGRPSTAGTVLNRDRGSAAYQLLQATLESERTEFEELLSDRNKLIREKEKQISDLKAKLESVETATASSSDAKAGPLVDELRTRLVAQIKVSTALKEHFTKMNLELTNLRKEKELLEFRVRELTQELDLAKALSRPENEILAGLTEKVEHLNSRYFYREKQLDSLLNRLAVQNSSPRLASLDLYSRNVGTYSADNNNQESTILAGLDLARLSPTLLDLLGHASDLFMQ